MGGPFDDGGNEVTLDSYSTRLDQYYYGSWDDAVRKEKYEFQHEPLVTTFEDVKEEHHKLFDVAASDLTDELLVDPFLSISMHVVCAKQLVPVRTSIALVPSAQSSGGGGGGGSRQLVISDGAFKGQFQRIMSDQKADSQWWEIASNVDDAVETITRFQVAVTGESFEINLSFAPFLKLINLFEDKVGGARLPAGIEEFCAKHKKRPGSGGGKRAKRVEVDEEDDLLCDDEDDSQPKVARLKRPRRVSDASNAIALDDDEDGGRQGGGGTQKGGVSLAKFEAFKTTNTQKLKEKADMSAVDALKSEFDTVKSQMQTLGSASSPNPGTTSQVVNLEKMDAEMRIVMSNMASIVAILASNMDSNNPCLKAAQCVMNAMLSQMNNVFQWNDERKRLILDLLKDQTALKTGNNS